MRFASMFEMLMLTTAYQFSGAARIFLLEGQNRTGSGAAPEKFSRTTPSTLAIDATNALFKD